jgi:transcriptional regulator with XRE-family HTH domain
MTAERTLGEHLRSFRTARAMSLRALADRAQVTASFLSQLENGRTSASVATLRRLADALGIGLADLLDPTAPSDRVLVRRGEHPLFPSTDGIRKYCITQPPLRAVEVYVGDLDPGAETGPDLYTHGNAQEIFLVLGGEVLLHLGEETIVMHQGDSVEFQSSVPHRLVNASDGPAKVLWVNSPPTPD